MKNTMVILILSFVASACNNNDRQDNHKSHVETIAAPALKKELLDKILLINNNPALKGRKDTLLFLILPVNASCPACRDKTIDSINKYKNSLDEHHFVIVSGPGSRDINFYFKERGHEIISNSPNIYLDTLDLATREDLSDENPVIYLAYQGEIIKKVTSTPTTIKKDLKKFFTAMR